MIKDGFCQVRDVKHGLIGKAQMTSNVSYIFTKFEVELHDNKIRGKQLGCGVIGLATCILES